MQMQSYLVKTSLCLVIASLTYLATIRLREGAQGMLREQNSNDYQ